ncbi:MAG TPA: four helix bundle protein [bacterium]|nr:four helix bundle protein [bacterium]
MSENYKDLLVWKKAMVLVTDIYRQSLEFPKEETYGLTSQLRRSAVSIPSNIAEGKGGRSAPEFHMFLGHARGSLLELETQIQIAENLGYLNSAKGQALLKKTSELGKMLNGLMEAISRRK